MTNEQIRQELVKELKRNERLAALLILHGRNQSNAIAKTAYPVCEPMALNRVIGQAQGVDTFIKTLTKDYAAFHEASDLDLLKGL